MDLEDVDNDDNDENCVLSPDVGYGNKFDGSFGLFHTNICSIDANMDQLTVLLNRLNVNFSVVGLSETWERCSVIEHSLPGYALEKGSCNLNKNSGASLFISQVLTYKVLSQYVSSSCDVVVVEIFGVGDGGSVVLGLIYRSSSGDFASFLDYWSFVLGDLARLGKSACFFGDFNVNIRDTSSSDVLSFLGVSSQYGFRQLVKDVTRPGTSGGSSIDLIFMNFGGSTSSGVVHSQVSDHFPTFVFFYGFAGVNVNPAGCLYEKFDNDIFMTALADCSLSDVFHCTDLDDGVCCLIKKLRSCIDKATITSVKFKRYVFGKKPWVTASLLRCIRRRDKLKNRLNKDMNNDCLRRKYRLYRNTLNKALIAARCSYFRRKISVANNDPGITWRVVRQVRGNVKCGDGPSHIILDGGDLITDKRLVADEFNDFFVNLGGPVGSTFSSSVGGLFGVDEERVHDSVFLSPVTVREIEGILGSLNSKRTKGLDGSSNYILKLGRFLIAPAVAYLVNLMIAVGKFPDSFKCARVRPVYKGGSRTSVKNYRPIAVLSSLGKVFEKVIFIRLNSFFVRHSLLCEEQFGFRAGRGADTAVASLVNYIRGGLDNREFVAMVGLDIRKAFDTLNHGILLRKLSALGVRGLPNRLIRSYLEDRSQFVEVNSVRSSVKTVCSGVPQGSILGPLLFLVYVNDLPAVKGDGFMVMFADDNALCVRGGDLRLVNDSMQSFLNNVIAWYSNNLLSVNFDKSHYVVFASPWKISAVRSFWHTIFLEVDGVFFLPEDEIMYLGVTLDKNLKWWGHIFKLRSKLGRIIGLFYKLRRIFPSVILYMLFHSLFQSAIYYCISSYGCTHSSKLDVIFRLQKHAVRVINFLRLDDSTEVFFRENGVLTVYMLNVKSVLVLGAKIWNGLLSLPGISFRRYNCGSLGLRERFGCRLQEVRFTNDSGRFMLNVRFPFLVNRMCDCGCDVLTVLPIKHLGRMLRKVLLTVDVLSVLRMF